MFFPGVATVAALNNDLAGNQAGLTVAFVIAVLIEAILTAMIVLTLWRRRGYAVPTSK